MKRLILCSILLISCLYGPVPATAQVRFDANFESGSLGPVEQLDSARIVVAP